MARIPLNLDDFPQDRANCGTCQQRSSLFCERVKYKASAGCIKGLCGNLGVIYKCVNYVGVYS